MTDMKIGTSDVPKKLHRKPLTRYKTGLNFDIICQSAGNIEILQKVPPKKTRGVTKISGIRFNFSQLVAHIPMMNPNKEKLTDVKNKNTNIQPRCFILKEINSVAVINIIRPIKIDLVAAAPT